MTRIWPSLISQSDVVGLLGELDRAVPYSNDNWQTASLYFNTIDLCVNIRVNIRVNNGRLEDGDRHRVAEMIRLLPQMHSAVVAQMSRPTDEGSNDDHGLSWIDVDFDDGEIDLCYNGISYNTQWNRTFHLSSDGKLIS